jgi:hypothetical protein
MPLRRRRGVEVIPLYGIDPQKKGPPEIGDSAELVLP